MRPEVASRCLEAEQGVTREAWNRDHMLIWDEERGAWQGTSKEPTKIFTEARASLKLFPAL